MELNRVSDSKFSSIEIECNISDYSSKYYRYSQESYFQESWSQFEQPIKKYGLDCLARCTFLIFKPDAAAGRCLKKTINHMSSLGFDPIYFRFFKFNRLMIRELWRYELNLSSLCRYPVIDDLLQASNSLFMIFSCRLPILKEPATNLISRLKGPSSANKRLPSCIRSQIGAFDGTLNFIHSPDETIDFIRELGVLFDKNIRNELIEAVFSRFSKKNINIQKLEEEFYGNIPHISNDLGQLILKICGKKAPERLSFDSSNGKRWVSENLETILNSNSTVSRWEEIFVKAFAMYPSVSGVKRILEYEQRQLFD